MHVYKYVIHVVAVIEASHPHASHSQPRSQLYGGPPITRHPSYAMPPLLTHALGLCAGTTLAPARGSTASSSAVCSPSLSSSTTCACPRAPATARAPPSRPACRMMPRPPQGQPPLARACLEAAEEEQEEEVEEERGRSALLWCSAISLPTTSGPGLRAPRRARRRSTPGAPPRPCSSMGGVARAGTGSLSRPRRRWRGTRSSGGRCCSCRGAGLAASAATKSREGGGSTIGP